MRTSCPAFFRPRATVSPAMPASTTITFKGCLATKGHEKSSWKLLIVMLVVCLALLDHPHPRACLPASYIVVSHCATLLSFDVINDDIWLVKCSGGAVYKFCRVPMTPRLRMATPHGRDTHGIAGDDRDSPCWQIAEDGGRGWGRVKPGLSSTASSGLNIRPTQL
ncbi:uncharacterized protein BO97DRAFT_24059 [Aspergillus homomorphus CBS 101889]|uniref:Uncharacterized protein n=1 Tax=Aspergillus homomorphus (strain CBS 101889) TaxID=1450537 RepID=A0A395HF92_ASPHC|nr:hypothetical protein BO97DRAFT_24059 [Aspergillus homomorphus CBS 101889]RAL06562.1 hypothetical protein BO97DRAFT_24059 [Aspergillus homomorphus CBS 101889]